MKTNKLLKGLALFMGLIFTLGATGCKDPDTGKTNEPSSEYIAYNVQEYPTGVHRAIVKDSETVIYEQNTKSSLKIVVPSNLTYYENIALEELVHFLQLSTNNEFEVVLDSEDMVFNENDKYISLGLNEWFFSSGLVVNVSSLKSTGYRLLTKGNTMFIVGSENGFGIVNGVYGLLEYLINYKCYSTDCIVYDQTNKLTLKELDVTEIPAIETVTRANIAWSEVKDLVRMHLVDLRAEFGMPTFGHNLIGGLVSSADYAANAGWKGSEQPCFSNRDLADKVVENVFKMLMDDKSARLVFIGQMDGSTGLCQCTTCQEERALYGPQESALVIRFVNYIAERVDAKLVEVGDTRNIQYATYAYLFTEEPPVKKLADGTYEANHPSVKPNSNVAIMLAPIYAEYNTSFKEEENAYTRTIVDAWASISEVMWSYTYGVNFHDYFVGLNNIGALQGNFQYLAETGNSFAYVQCKYGGKGHETAQLTPLRQFLISELGWNPYADVNALIKEFMSVYYGPAAEAVYDYYETYRLHYAYLESEFGVDGNIFYDFSADHWDHTYVKNVEACFKNAFAALEELQEQDYNSWKTYYDRVNFETLHYRYLQLNYHRSLYAASTVREMIDSFEADCNYFNIEQYKEVDYISNLIGTWRNDL